MLSTIFIFNKTKRYWRSGIKDNCQKYQLGRCYDVSKTSVSFRYQLERLCDLFSWLVSLRCQLVHRYDVLNWSVLFTYQWDVAKTSHIRPSYWRISWDVVMMSQHRPGRSNWSVKWVYFIWLLDSTFCGISSDSVTSWYVATTSQRPRSHLGIIVSSLRHVKLVSPTEVSIGTSLRRFKLVGFIIVPIGRRKDVRNRSVSFTFQLWRHDDISACSATFRPISDLKFYYPQRLCNLAILDSKIMAL